MYLSKIPLNPMNRKTIQAIANPQQIHGMIEDCFPGPRERRLWRVDQWKEELRLLIMSNEAADFTSLVKQIGYPHIRDSWQTKEIDGFFSHLKKNQIWHFRLRANPVHSKIGSGDNIHRGKIYAHATTDYQRDWLLKRQEDMGIELKEDDFDVVEKTWLNFKKKDRNHVRIRAVTYEGYLKITDVDRLKEAMIKGIGRGKAYGCGMLTLAR